MICETCQREHVGDYGSGRFCSRKCARSFSTQKKRAEINEKVSKTLSKKDDEARRRQRELKKVGVVPNDMPLECATCGRIAATKAGAYTHSLSCFGPFHQLSSNARRRILLREAGHACSNCGYSQTREDGRSILEIDHIDGNPSNNVKDNLRVLCPNCHALTPTFRNHKRH